MKTIIIAIAIIFVSISVSAKPVTVRSKDIKELRTETINGISKFYVILKDGKVFQLHTKTQLRGIEVLSMQLDVITFETKENR